MCEQALVTQPGLEYLRPKEGAEGSNPSERVFKMENTKQNFEYRLIAKAIQDSRVSLHNFKAHGYLLTFKDQTKEVLISLNQPLEDMVLTLIHETLHTLPEYAQRCFKNKKQMEEEIEIDSALIYMNSCEIRSIARERIIGGEWPMRYQMSLPFGSPTSMRTDFNKDNYQDSNL